MTARGARPAAALLAALVLTGGCAGAQLPGAAAVVDGRVIPTSDVATTTRQMNEIIKDPTQQMTEAQTVYWMVIAPFVNAKVESTGRWSPDTAYNTLLSAVREPTSSTVAVLKARLGVAALTQEDRQDVVAQIAGADIRLDPRFGTINPQTGGLEKQEPNWIKPTATAAP